VPVCCVAGTMLDFGLAGVGVIFLLAMVALYENSCSFVLRCNFDPRGLINSTLVAGGAAGPTYDGLTNSLQGQF